MADIGGSWIQFTGALWDAFQAAGIGLNPVPLIIFSLFIGTVQATRRGYFVKAAIATVAGAVIAALWPAALGYQPIWPDLTQFEGEFQIAILLVLALMIIALTSLVKFTVRRVHFIA